MHKSKKEEHLTEELVKNVMLDYSEVNPECPESVRKYGERCTMVGELYNGYKNYMKIVAQTNSKSKSNKMEPKQLVSQHTTAEIERLISYKDEYIG